MMSLPLVKSIGFTTWDWNVTVVSWQGHHRFILDRCRPNIFRLKMTFSFVKAAADVGIIFGVSTLNYTSSGTAHRICTRLKVHGVRTSSIYEFWTHFTAVIILWMITVFHRDSSALTAAFVVTAIMLWLLSAIFFLTWSQNTIPLSCSGMI